MLNVNLVPPEPIEANAIAKYRIPNWKPEGFLHEVDPRSQGSGFKDSSNAVKARRTIP